MTDLKCFFSRGNTKVFIPICVAFAFYFFLWLMDFPKPWGDDLFFCGSALNLTNGGHFTNPFINWLPGQPFFFQPPVHSYVLAAWLKVFGVSAGSLTGFQVLMYFFAAAAIV